MLPKTRKAPSFLLILCLAACLFSVSAGNAGEAKNFLWKVQSRTATLYLFGSIHFLKNENYPLNPAIEKAFAQSNVLVVEADITDPGKLAGDAMLRKALYPGNDTLQNHVSAETFALLKREAEALGLPIELVDRQRPWMVALTLEALELVRLGFDPAFGIDSYFLSKAKGSKSIMELEGLERQINLLSGFSEKDQELFLVYTLRDLKTRADQTQSLVKAWSTGNPEVIESIITKSAREDRRLEPILAKLLNDRNRDMVSAIEGYLATKLTYFVVVGAGHMVGDRGIVKLLKERGYSVEQL